MYTFLYYEKLKNINTYLLISRPTVKKGAALFKMAIVKKVVKSKGAAKKLR